MDIEKIRQDFPILQKKINEKSIIYLDSSCMSLKPKQVINKMNEYYHDFPACGGRSVHRLGTRVTISVDSARIKFQNFLNTKHPEEIVFLRNATEGLNLVANSLQFNPDDRVLITDREHNSNLIPWLQLKAENRIKLEVVPSNEDNTFNIETLENMMGNDVKLISMVHTANLDGYTIPASEIIKIAHDHGAYTILDGAQSAPHMNIDVQALDVDFFVISVHKMCGPTGIGVLFGKQQLLEELTPFIVGGSTVKSSTYSQMEYLPPPEKFEAGLQNYAGIIGAGTAVEYLMNIGMDNIHEYDVKLNKLMTDLLSNHEEIELIGPKEPELRGCVYSFNIKGMDSHDVAMILDEMNNIMIRSGMQCVHSWFNKNNMRGSARASIYFYNTEEEIKVFAESVSKIIENFQ